MLALSKSGETFASEKSFNNHIGVPLSLARMPQDCAYGVFEVGMNHAGEIDALVRMVRPHCAIITHVGTAHIEHFDSEADIARAKGEIFNDMANNVVKGGTVIIPRTTRMPICLSNWLRPEHCRYSPLQHG